MEVILVHKAIGIPSPELMKANLELGKTMKTGPSPMVPGGNLLSTYMASAQWVIFCIWDVPTVESLLPLLRQMTLLGWNTEVIPVQKAPDAARNIEKALAEMAKK